VPRLECVDLRLEDPAHWSRLGVVHRHHDCPGNEGFVLLQGREIFALGKMDVLLYLCRHLGDVGKAECRHLCRLTDALGVFPMQLDLVPRNRSKLGGIDGEDMVPNPLGQAEVSDGDIQIRDIDY